MCPHSNCAVALICVQCLGAVKWRTEDKSSVRKLTRCQCKNPLSGDACFNERWLEIWQPEIHRIASAISKPDRGLAEQAVQAQVLADENFQSKRVGEDGVQIFMRKALLYILDQFHLHEAADLEALRRHQLAQRASDPTWVILQKAADRQHWVISVEDMATAVADSLHKHVQILRGSALGHTHTGVTAFGRWDDVDNSPICLLMWNDLLWRCEATAPPPPARGARPTELRRRARCRRLWTGPHHGRPGTRPSGGN